jgi:membrane protein DedA with SNARE-associated domain
MPWLRFMLTSIIGTFLLATLFGLAAYSLGRQVERLTGWMALAFGLGILIVIVVAAVFVKRHEAQLAAEAEQALLGPLKLP